MKRFTLAHLWRNHAALIVLVAGVVVVLAVLATLRLTADPGKLPQNNLRPPITAQAPTPMPTAIPTPTATPQPAPTPTLPARTVSLNPAHGIHAPIGFQWTDPQRQALASFKDSRGTTGAPGLVLALSTDMQADNNQAKVNMEQDLYQYQRQGAEIYIRLYPQRFPGGFSEEFASFNGRNTISGTPEDAAEDIFNFLNEQQKRNGWHFTRLIPGNEPDLEWPDIAYGYNLLPWTSRGDPAKYVAINDYFAEVFRGWQRRVTQPDAILFRDVTLYFPPLAQDSGDNLDTYAGYYYYEGVKPVGNRYDRLREAIELYGRFSWHNYFVPGRACQDVAAANFPGWLKQGLESGWPAVIGEAGWGPDKLALPAQNDSRARLVRFWSLLGLKWEERLYKDERPHWMYYDDVVNGAKFEEDITRFVQGCYLGGLKTPQPVGVSVWLAGSEGNFEAAIGVEPGQSGRLKRWLIEYANLKL